MTDKTELPAKKPTAIQKVDTPDAKLEPVFVAAEKMFEKFADVSREIGRRAYDFFRERGGEFGKELDDWFKAENEILRPVPVEITESDSNIFVKAAVPGYKPEEINVSVKDDVLMISGTAEEDKQSEDANTVLREWNSNHFYRQLTLPSNVIADKVVAKITNGMLELTLPKTAAKEETKVAVTGA